MDRFDIWGLICILVSAGFLATALRIYARRKRFLAVARAAEGTVVGVRVEGVGRNAESFPLLEFRTAGGDLQRTESLMGSGFRGFAVGETVKIRYDPTDPSKADVDSFAVLWGLTLLRAGYALAFFLMGAIALLL